MRPVAVEVVEFRGWRSSGPVPLDRPLTLLLGDNGRGKSGLLQAIEWCLVGRDAESVKRSGLAERVEFEVRPRVVGARDTAVTLTLAGRDGTTTVMRRRPVGAKQGAADDVAVTLPTGRVLTDDVAQAWIGAHLADAATWRRAHCLHADAVRARALNDDDLSTVLAGLLGLDDGVRGREALAAVRTTKLVGEVEALLRGLESDLLASLERPRRDRDDLERRLEGRGVPRGDLGEARTRALRAALVERARTLASRLGLATVVPAAHDVDAVRAWAPGWPSVARASAPALVALPGRRDELARLETAITGQAPAEEAYRSAQDAYRKEIAAGGDQPARTAALAAARAAQQEADATAKRQGALVELLEDAKKVVAGPACPVCGTTVDGLGARLDAELRRLAGPERAALAQARTAAAEAVRAAEAALGRVDALIAQGQRLRAAWEGARRQLASVVPGAVEGADLAAVARARAEALRAEIAALDALARERDDALREHARDAELLRDLEAWAEAVARMDADVDVTTLPAHARLEAALDETAGFAADVEAVAAFLRDVQSERSTAREAQVNRLLADYYDLIVGGDARGLAIETHQAPKSLAYRLVDRHGKPALPILNQAALNAVSLALLFAQAAERARAGGLALVVLDDPTQSLDAERQAGLAKAVERLAATCAVVVATTDGPFVERVRSHVAVPRRFLTLAPWDPRRGAAFLGEGEER